MIECATGRSAWDFLGYGCWCGLGGRGTPVDGVDRYEMSIIMNTTKISSCSLWFQAAPLVLIVIDNEKLKKE